MLVAGCAHREAARGLASSTEAVFDWPGVGVAIETGRVERGGPERLWVADDRSIWELGPGSPPREVLRLRGFADLVRFQAADLDGDGVSEWLLTDRAPRTRTRVFAHREGAWAPRGRPYWGWVRVEGASLSAQRAGGDGPFAGPVRDARWDGTAVVEGAPRGGPDTLGIFDTFVVPAEPTRLFAIEWTGHLSERDPRTPVASLWRADARTVARPIEIEADSTTLLGEPIDGTVALPAPVRVVPRGDGWDVLVVSGPTNPVPVLPSLRVLQGGDVRAYSPQPGRGLAERVRTPLLGVAVAAMTPFATADGRNLWALLVWTRDPGGFLPPRSRVLLCDPETGDLVAAGALSGATTP
jgi:hypothetical protein